LGAARESLGHGGFRLEGEDVVLVTGVTRPQPAQAAVEAGPLLLVAAGAWAGTVLLARGMAGMTGTMGLGLAAFVPVWTLMMAAMMLPSVGPAASRYARSPSRYARSPSRYDRNASRYARSAAGTAGLAGGYLAIWAAAGVPAFGLAWLAGWVTGRHPGAAHIAAVAVFAACGVYQLSGPKERCLTRCRAALPPTRRGGWPGALAAGVRHGASCLGCCWGLMVILVAVGVMNVAAMVGLAVVVLTEKTSGWGPAAGRLSGVAALGLAVAIIWLPWLVPGLHAAHSMTMG
jgi:predicted metal-binding membrane protein